jgi:hypothetical protein
VRAIDRTDGDGVVSGGDVIEVRAFVSDFDSGVQDVLAFPEPFGVEQVVLTNENGDLYNATFVVNGSDTFPDDVYPITITATDGANNVANATTGLLELNTTGDGEANDTTAPGINATAIDRTDGDGAVSDGDLVEVRAVVTDDGSGVGSVIAFPEPFGVSNVTLTETAFSDVYNATFTVDASAPDGRYGVPVLAEDAAGNLREAFTGELRLNTTGDGETNDTTPPEITDVRAVDRTDGDGVVSGGDVIEVRAFVSDLDSGVQDVLAFPEPFGVEQVVLTKESGDLYNATFVVNGTRAFADGIYRIPLIAVDGAENVANATTSGLTLNASGDGGAGGTTPPVISNATAIDRTDGDGVVSEGDLIEVRATVTDADDNVSFVEAFPEPFGVNQVVLTNTAGDHYNGTFVVGSDFTPINGSYRILVSAEDSLGNFNDELTNELQVNASASEPITDVTPPAILNATAIDRTDGDATVGGGDLVEVRVQVTDNGSGIDDVIAFTEAFGTEQIALTGVGNGTYNGTFRVDENLSAPAGTYAVGIVAGDRAGNVANTTTNPLTLNVTRQEEDVTPPTILDVVAIDRTDNDSVVSDGDLIEVRVTVTDNGSGVADVVALPEAFGADEVLLTNAGGDVYNGTFRVDAALAAPDDVYPVRVVAVDGAGNDAEATSNLLDLDRATRADALVNITGSIADGSSGGANTVSAFVRGTGDGFPPRISVVDQTVTDPSGNFTLEVPANGTYDIVYYEGNFRDEQNLLPRNGIPDVFAVERITVGESATAVDGRSLPEGHDLNVSVVDESGNPVEGARIAYFHTENDSDGPALAGLDTLPTNANGLADASGVENVTRDRPGIEVAGNVTVFVAPPEGDDRFVARTYTRTRTVTEDGRITVTLQEAEEPGLVGERTIEGTAIPGENISVTVQVRATAVVDAPAVDENLPEGFSIVSQSTTPDATYRQSEDQWVWLSTSENDTLTVNYTVAVPENVSAGETFEIGGTVSSNDQSPVELTGDRTIQVGTCINRAVAGADGEISLPEIQSAINAWAEDQPLDNTGGQTISLPKIQELINAWAEDQAVSCSA